MTRGGTYAAAVELIRANDQLRVLTRVGRATVYDIEHVYVATAAWTGTVWFRHKNRWGAR